MTVEKTVCGMCGADNCGINVHLEEGRIVAITGMGEYPVNRGRLCPQAKAAIELNHDPQRLQYPLKRAGDSWQRISWGVALDSIAAKLNTLKATEGPETLAVYQGRALLQFLKCRWPDRFLNLYGSPNLVRNDHMCAVPTAIAEKITFGAPTVYGFDAQDTRCLLLWGSNPAASHIPFIWRDMLEAQRRGCRVIVIDPRRTQSAAKADIHVSLRPGTDLALALGLLHVIVGDGLYDAEFVRQWTVGFDLLAERVKQYTPARVETITGVSAEMIQCVAHAYATIKPAHLDAGNSLEHHSNSAQALRAVMILRAITGNLDVPGGNVLLDSLPLADVSLKEMRPANIKPLGADRYPVFVEHADFVPGDALIDAILEEKPYPVKSMVIAGGNPALTWPNSWRVRQALSKLDFLVVIDLYMTATAQYADLVLPAASALERTQLIVRSGPYGADNPTWYLMLRKPVVEAGERRSDWWFWSELGHWMGYSEHYPWADEEQAINHLLSPLGITVADLKANPSGMFHGGTAAYRRYTQGGFNTPSGKVELYSSVLAAAGYDPLPAYQEPAESPVSAPELAQEYPLVLTTGRRVAAYTASRHRNLSSLRRMEPEPLAEIHPATAQAYGIKDADWIEVESLRGRIQLKAKVTDYVGAGMISLLYGWEEANANLLTDDQNCDPILSCPPLRSALCQVRRIGEIRSREQHVAATAPPTP